MSLYTDIKYVNLVSPQLPRFKRKSEFLWNCRCPYCGDSAKSQTKARGYIYRMKNGLFYRCHNCYKSVSLGSLIKDTNPSLHKEYILEEFKKKNSTDTSPDEESAFRNTSLSSADFHSKKLDLPTIESLPDEHYAKEYLKSRQIPKQYYSQFYFSENFKSLAEIYDPEKAKDLIVEPRLIIPFFDENNVMQGFQGRALLKSKVRYITVKVCESAKKVYGLNTVDLSKRVYVVEGIIDSLFLNNSIAMLQGALYSVRHYAGVDVEYVLISDNEPRNAQIVGNMAKAIQFDFKICVWPSNILEKDINEMVLSGRSGAQIQSIIDQHTYSGLRAQMEVSVWSKV